MRSLKAFAVQRHTARLWSCARVTLLLVLVTGAASCKRGVTTVCREDIDCPPGFDCVGTSCVHRARMRFGTDARPARAEAVTAPTLAPDAGPGVDATSTPPSKPEAPPSKSLAPAQPAPPSPPADQPRLPLWKERLKNS